jgi:hypothetical protein
MNLGLHGLMIAVMAWTMLVAVSGASALLGAVVLIAASVPCALVARRSASGWRHIVDLWAMAGLLIVAATSALPAISRLAASPLTSSAVMGGMAHGVAMSLASPSGLALAVVAAWLTCRLALTAGAVRRGERMARLGLGSAVVTAAGLGLMLAFH